MKRKKKPHPKKHTRLLFFYSLALTSLLIAVIFAHVFISNKPVFTCANSESCIEDLSGKKSSDSRGIFLGKTVYSPQLTLASAATNAPSRQVLAARSYEHKRIYVDLTNQKLYAFEGSSMIMDVPVSTGKWYPTPTGEFRIWIWLRYTRMSGGTGAGYYNLPNVPFTMYYYNDKIAKTQGFSIHGAYWHENFGQPMSHGCVNMRIADAEKLFNWTIPSAGFTVYPPQGDPGVLVTVYGKTPRT